MSATLETELVISVAQIAYARALEGEGRISSGATDCRVQLRKRVNIVSVRSGEENVCGVRLLPPLLLKKHVSKNNFKAVDVKRKTIV